MHLILVFPAGSGKTFVALKICKEHIRAIQDSKVVFLIPRVPLVNQQHKLFKRFNQNFSTCDVQNHRQPISTFRFLGDEPNLLLRLTSETSQRVPLHISLQKHKIAFMTPQILLNLLKYINCILCFPAICISQPDS